MHQSIATGPSIRGLSVLTIKTILKQLLAKRFWMGAREMKVYNFLFASVASYCAVYHQNIMDQAHWSHYVCACVCVCLSVCTRD